MHKSLKVSCALAKSTGIAIPEEVQTIGLIKAKELVVYLSKNTGLPEGGDFTYGITHRLIEVINKRDGTKTSNLDAVWLHRTDVSNLISLLDNEIKTKDTRHTVMNEPALKEFSHAVFDDFISNSNNKKASFEAKGLYQESSFFKQLTEFFLKVASVLSDNTITNSIEK